jgi:RNA polymerase primary sigma factor
MKATEKKTTKERGSSKDMSDPIRLYLRDVSKNPLLVHAQEIELSKAIGASKQAIMDMLFAIPLTVQTITSWISEIAGGTKSATEIFDVDLNAEEAPSVDFMKQLVMVQGLCSSYLADLANPEAKAALVSAFNDLPLTPATMDQLMKQVQAINSKLIKLDGEMLRLATACGVERTDFIERYVGHEHMDWLAKMTTAKWKRFAKDHAADITRIKTAAHADARTAGLTINELRLAVRDLGVQARAKETAINTMVRSNLRLVVSVAKKYNHASNNQHNLMDLIQEGNIGLIKAVEKFKWELGYRFSTYATWWIRQAIFKAAAEQNRTIRIPSHVIDSIKKINRAIKDHVARNGKEPTMAEISAAVEMDEMKIARMQRVARDPISLETPVGDEDDGKLGNYIEDIDSENAFEQIAKGDVGKVVAGVLGNLSSREERVIRMRFGIGTMEEYTLEEIGQKFNVTRERVRQIEAKALERLKSPARTKELAMVLKD